MKSWWTSPKQMFNKALKSGSIASSLSFRKTKQIDYSSYRSTFYTDVKDAIPIINERRQNATLKEKVDKFLNNSVPAHFDQIDPIMYLARHIATPNFEALHFIELAKPFSLPIVIGQDAGCKFVAMNPLKRCLGKMSIVSGMTRYQDEIIENFTIIDFNASEGKKMRELHLKSGESLISFHNNLLHEIYPDLVTVAEEESWVNEHYRNNLVKQYEQMLAMNSFYGIIFESFPQEETTFFNEIFVPAFQNVTKALGVKPLVVELLTEEEDAARDWNHYPSVVYPFVKRALAV